MKHRGLCITKIKRTMKAIKNVLGTIAGLFVMVFVLSFVLVFACIADMSRDIAECRNNDAGRLVAWVLSPFAK